MTLLGSVTVWLLLLALAATLLRRIPWLPGLVVALGLLLLAWQLWSSPALEPARLFGRPVDAEGSTRFLGFTLYLGRASLGPALILLVWGALFALAAIWVEADRVLYPSIPLILLALILALSSTPLLWAPLWLVVAAVGMTFPSQGATPRLARAALRTLVAPVLALPFFLFAAWVLAQPAVAADDPALWANAYKALAVGAAFLLTPVPLHGWIVAQGDHAPPLAAAFVVGVWQITVYALIRQIFLVYPTLADFADPARWLPLLAISQMAWAGVFGLGSNRLHQLYGYLLLWAIGANYLLWSISGEFGTQTMIWLLLVFPLPLLLAASGLQALSQRYGEGATYRALAGASERLPWASLAFVAGGLFLAGWPLGALYPLRLATFRLAQASERTVFLLGVLSLFLLALGMIRALRALTQPLIEPDLAREPRRLFWLVLPLFLTNALLALNPSLLEALSFQLADWMTKLR